MPTPARISPTLALAGTPSQVMVAMTRSTMESFGTNIVGATDSMVAAILRYDGSGKDALLRFCLEEACRARLTQELASLRAGLKVVPPSAPQSAPPASQAGNGTALPAARATDQTGRVIPPGGINRRAEFNRTIQHKLTEEYFWDTHRNDTPSGMKTLKDCTKADLEYLAARHRASAAGHTKKASFFSTLSQQMTGTGTVGDQLNDADVAALYREQVG